VKIMEACAGLRVWPGRDREYLWITGVVGLGGMAQQSVYHADLCRPGGGGAWPRAAEIVGV
jgi:hypothetical protein